MVDVTKKVMNQIRMMVQTIITTNIITTIMMDIIMKKEYKTTT